MSSTRNALAALVCGGLGGGVVLGGLYAAASAASGGIGGRIFNSAGLTDYSATESAQMGAVGGAILGGSFGVIGGAVSVATDSVAALGGQAAIGAAMLIPSVVLSGLVGYSVMNDYAATETVMNLGQTALSLLVGSAVLEVGAGTFFGCCVAPCLAACGVIAKNDKTPELDKGDIENQSFQAEEAPKMRM